MHQGHGNAPQTISRQTDVGGLSQRALLRSRAGCRDANRFVERARPKPRAQVFGSGVGENGNHDTLIETLRPADRGVSRSPGGDTGEEPLLGEQSSRHGHRVLGAHQDPGVDCRRVEHRRDISVVERPEPGHRLPHRRLGGHDLHRRMHLTERLADSHQGPPRPEPGYEGIHPVERAEDLRTGPRLVGPRVGRIAVLEQHEVTAFGGQVGRPGDRAIGSLFARGENDIGPPGAEEIETLLADVVGHQHGEIETFPPSDPRQGDPRVARRRLHQPGPWPEQTRGPRLLHHRLGDPVLHRAGGVEPFQLRPDLHCR